MKKISPWLIVVWSLLFVAGLACGLIGSLTSAPGLPLWIIATCIWIGDVVWLLVKLLGGKKKRKNGKSIMVGNHSFNRILKETEEAVERYTDAVNRKGILKKSALYERPWFLLCGSSKSGKSSLLNGSGLTFPIRYPSEKDGLLVEGTNQIMWYFANEAVWIDTPGALMEESGRDDWQALIAAMQRVRPGNPADGVAMVVDTNEVLNTDNQGIKDLAKKLRSRIDELISLWGIEFPVYLLFNRTDEVPGFNEYFADQLDHGGEQIFGATIPAKMLSAMPRAVFAEEFNLLCKSLTDLRLDKLFKERTEAKRRMICRFVIHFEGIQQKLGALVAELFKPSSYEGKPLFRGFYFTSCTEFNTEKSSSMPTVSSDMSSTVVNHPLNPNRAFSSGAQQQPKIIGQKKSTVRSAFVLPLFREIMVKDKSLVNITQKRTRREMIRHYSIIGVILLAGLLISGAIFQTHRKTMNFMKGVETTLAKLPPENAPLMEQYTALEIVHSLMSRLQKYEDRGTPLTMGIGFYRGKAVLSELKKSYFYRLSRFMVVPAVKYLEYDLRSKTSSFGELAGDEYENLYRTLKAYLSISEGGPTNMKDIDTVFLRGALLDAVKQSIVVTVQNSRLPSQVETILRDNMGLYLSYLCRKEFPRIQENQRLVESARKRLSHLPSASALYDAVINRLMGQDVPSFTLDNILKREGEGILQSPATISALYTQEGWDQYVSDAITEAASNPFRVDWVIGLTSDDIPESSFDKKQLRSEMVDVYLEDFKTKWLQFLGSISMEPFGDLQRTSRILEKLANDQSEISILLETVATYSMLKEVSEAEAAGGKALEEASKIKATKKLAKNVKKAKERVNFSLGSSSPFDNHNAFFDHLRSFVRSTDGEMSGFNGYKDKAMTLAEKCGTIGEQEESKAIEIFNGKPDDPLLNGWNYSQKTLNGMPEELAASLRNILMQPFEYTGIAATKVLTRTLNAKWQQEIIKPFTSRFSGRYPFFSRGDEASFTDVMDFFRPVATGTFWGFYDRVLTSFIKKDGNKWMVLPLGSLQLQFNPEILQTLANAERIKNIFFKDDGTLRMLDITVIPSASNKQSANLIVGTQELELKPGGKSGQLRWPIESNTNATLKVLTSGGFSQEITKNGAWGFMKLLQMARCNKMNNSSFAVKWQVNIQNQFMVFIEARIQVAGSDHPFSDKVFESFNCPTELLKPFVEETVKTTTLSSDSISNNQE